MQKKQMPDFTTNRVFKEDGTFEFQCSHDLNIWPWLALHPHDPIYLQTMNFWTPFEAGIARGEYTPEKWTALTETRWELGTSNVGKPVRGVAAPVDENNIGYNISLYDDTNKLVYKLTGKGVIFQNRDFSAWRQSSKDKMAALTMSENFEYAPYELTGAATQSQSFISRLTDGKSAQALVTTENGFLPEHPYLSGSGDHVNATHLHVIGDQFTVMLEGGRTFTSPSGTMTFNRYVELNYPIEIKTNHKADGFIDLSFYQAGKLCAGMSFGYEINET